MAKDLLSAVREGDVRIVELTRKEARALIDADEDVLSKLEEDLDEAQGDADEKGKVAYVVLKINGGPL